MYLYAFLFMSIYIFLFLFPRHVFLYALSFYEHLYLCISVAPLTLNLLAPWGSCHWSLHQQPSAEHIVLLLLTSISISVLSLQVYMIRQSKQIFLKEFLIRFLNIFPPGFKFYFTILTLWCCFYLFTSFEIKLTRLTFFLSWEKKFKSVRHSSS